MGKTALVVDDSEFMRTVLGDMIRDIDGISKVLTAKNGKQAISKCKTFKPAVVTMDITMPELGGIEATKVILSNDPQTKVIFVTGLKSKGYSQKAEDAGGLSYITKPFNKHEVINTIQNLI